MEGEGRKEMEEGNRGRDVHEALYLAASTNIHMYSSTGHRFLPARVEEGTGRETQKCKRS
jgi:hypothetical protein